EDFLKALIGTTQVKGGYYTRAAQDQAIAGFIERLEGGLYLLPPLEAADLADRPVRKTTKTVAVAGLVDETGLALARAYATPGVRLCLVGASDTLSVTAEDCRRRGARVDTFRSLDKEQPIDVLAVQAGSDFGRAMAVIDPLIEPLRRRGQGAVVLIGVRSEAL